MAVTLEILSGLSAAVSLGSELPLGIHVHKRVDKFRYNRSVHPAAVPVAYLENPPLDAWKNLRVVDRSYTVPVNSNAFLNLQTEWIQFRGDSAAVPYTHVLITNRVVTDSEGKQRPLFYRHDLPEGTVDVRIESAEAGNRIEVESGFQIDYDAGAIFTDYRNFFDPDTGAYKLFFVISSTEDGDTTHVLLNSQPAAREANWEDIDLDTGKLKEERPLYSRSGNTFTMNTSDTWYLKPVRRALIAPQLPAAKAAGRPWYLSFSAGDVSGLVNGDVRHYRLTEINNDYYTPYFPIKWSTTDTLLKVNEKTYSTTRPNIKVDPLYGLHLTIQAFNADGVLARVFTTDAAKQDTRFSTTSVFYEADKIGSWDESTGIVHLTIEIDASWHLEADYYYEIEDYTYRLLDLNPVTYPERLDHSYVFYVVPDTNDNDRSLHYLEVDSEGQVVFCSQSEGISNLPNLQLRDSDGSYNSDTVVGMPYSSDSVTDFLSEYAAGYANDKGYLILAEVSAVDFSEPEEILAIGTKREGGVPTPDALIEVLRRNPKVLQSNAVLGEDGQNYPKHQVMVVEAPLSLLEDYGGSIPQSHAEDLIRTHANACSYTHIRWVFPYTEYSVTTTDTAATISYTWEGPGLDYRIYRAENPAGEWELLDTNSDPAEASLTYVDSTVNPDSTYYYSVRIVEDGVEFPSKYWIGVRTEEAP